MKETDGWVKIKKYTDDEGKPVCQGCALWLGCKDMEYGHEGDAPGPTCEVWHGEGQTGLPPHLEKLLNNAKC